VSKLRTQTLAILPVAFALTALPGLAPAATTATTTPASAAPAPATAAAPATNSKPLSTSLGVVVFPAKGQNASKQAADEGECYAWSKGQTGVDPFTLQAPATTGAPAANASTTSADGSRAKGAVRGAAGGAVIGAVTGDAGKGAAIGATAGVMKGGADSRRAAQQSQQQAQADAAKKADQQKAALADQKALFDKGFAACLESRGYTVK
jgi:hypothetical protein